MSIDDAMTALTCALTSKDRLLAAEALAAAANREAERIRAAMNVSLYCCYQCFRSVPYLFDDSRCSRCTRVLPEA
ncbi:hypothetical protein [Xenophilus azovorans]|uniref:hypothetical protein n=1 Tax=Xenophilus azovorans TaxID=151755 RepID=UPI0012EE9C8A|nr:hypothetical protein [Xenophilus azovorans]